VHLTSKFIERLPEHYISKMRSVIDGVDNYLDLGLGNPDLSTPHFITQKLNEAILSGKYSGYPTFLGEKNLKVEIIKLYKKKYNVTLNENEIAIVPGGKTALSMISSTILEVQDSVLLPDPYYPDMLSALKVLGCKINFIPLIKENLFLPNFDSISPSLLNKIKMIYLNYPNNPTGAVANDEMFEKVIELAQLYGFYVLHDFAYGEIGFDNKIPKSFLSYKNSKKVGVELYSFSKAYNMAGMRIACVIGNSTIIRGIEKILVNFFTGIYKPIQIAAITAIKDGEKYKNELSNIYEKRRDVFFSFFDNRNFFKPKSTFYCWLEIPKNFNDSYEFFNYLLKQKKIGVFPGVGFGKQGICYIRVSLLDNLTNIARAARSIRECYI
jgi:aminotransferase